MLNIGGELAFLLGDIKFNNKHELLDKLRLYRNELKTYSKEDKKTLYPILSVSIQQAFYLSEWELKKYKKFCEFRSSYEKNKDFN